MKSLRERFCLVLLSLATGTMLFAGGTQEVKKETAPKQEASGETIIIITDFEDSSLAMRTYETDKVNITPEFTKDDKHSGAQALKIVTQDAAPEKGYFSGIDTAVPEGKGNWSALRTLKIWVNGSESGAEIRVVIEDAQKEQFTQSFFNNFKGWKEIALPIKKFIARTDWQDSKARLNNRIDYPVAFIHFFTTDKGDYTVIYDDIIVTDEGRKKGDDEDEEEFVPRVKPAHTLKDLAADYGIEIGAAATASEIRVPDLREIVARDFSSITAGNEMKLYVIGKEKGRYNFEPADTLVAFAKEHGMKMRGHTLVWHPNLPGWLEKGDWTRETLLALLKEYITTVVTRYKDDVYCWDVVNEPINDSGEFRNKDSIWYRVCGEEYIEKAFIWAHEADPDALLFINDYNVETINRKSNKLYDIVRKLKDKGVPIHGAGFQVHFKEEAPPSFSSMYKNVKRFIELGLDVHFTEVDVRIKSPVSEAKLKHQAEIYEEITKIAVSFEKVTSITMWGVSDLYSWIPSAFPGYGYPLLFDRYFNPKQAYYSMQVALVGGPAQEDYELAESGGHLLLPFAAVKADKVPVIDGVAAKGEWDNAIVYPFGFNQLNQTDTRLPGLPDLGGDWRIVYSGGTVYGLVRRIDDVTVTKLGQTWENDTVEVFFGSNNEFVQLRTVVGQDFEKHTFAGAKKALWSTEGDTLEFSIDLRYGDLEGMIIGWNIALADNDGAEIRDHQAYPLNGANKGWEGEGFGEMDFVVKGAKSERGSDPYIAPPFKAVLAATTPKVDGTIDTGEWDKAIVYGFAYNRLDAKNLTPPPGNDISGDWRLLFEGNTIYGLVTRKDDKTVTSAKNSRENDSIEIFIDVNNTFVSLRTPVGKNFEKSALTGARQAVWSKNGEVLEFSIELSADGLKGSAAGWNISLNDNDGGAQRKAQLAPTNGPGVTSKSEGLGLIIFE